MNAIAIRSAVGEELDVLLSLEAAAAANRQRAGFLDSACREGWVTVAENEQRLVGFAVVHRHFFSHPFLAVLIVDPAFRRQGVARRLVTQAIEVHGELWTSTNTSNAAAQALFAALGFVRAGVIEGLDAGDPELIYRRFSTDGAR